MHWLATRSKYPVFREILIFTDRLNGSYESLEYGFEADAFTDLTGGLAEWYNPADLKDNDFYLIRAAFQSGAVIGCLSVVIACLLSLLYIFGFFSVYLSSLPVAHLSDAPKRRLILTRDSVIIKDETTNVSSERQLIILVGQQGIRTHTCSDPKHYVHEFYALPTELISR